MNIWYWIAMYLAWYAISRFWTTYLLTKISGKTPGDEFWFLLFFPVFGEPSLIAYSAEHFGKLAHKKELRKIEAAAKAELQFRTELVRNKDILLAAIEEVEKLK